MIEDGDLLARFTHEGDQAAFGELVARHINLVYSTALRRVGGDVHLAQDVTQTVFSKLAWKARTLPGAVVLAGWLHEATRFAAAKVVRTERRRQAREQEASTMHDSTPETDLDWERLWPVVDAALGELRTADRDAVLLRFFERKELRVVGAALGISEDAAQKRVGRALEKLRTILHRRGVTLTPVALSAAVMESAVQAAPSGLAGSVAHASLAGTSAATGSLMAKVLETVVAAKAKFMIGGVAAVTLVTLLLVRPFQTPKEFHPVDLTPHFNRLLSSFQTSDSWGLVPRGRITLGGVPFQMDGKLDLTGLGRAGDGEFQPTRIGEIPVGRPAARLHLIHGTTYTSPDDAPVAEILLHYRNGGTQKLFILYGVHVRNWYWLDDETNSVLRDPRSMVAWAGAVGSGSINPNARSTRLFKTTFDNPRPAEEIRSMELLSLFARANSVIVAITLEDSPKKSAGSPGNPELDDAPYRREMQIRVLDAATGEPVANAVVKAKVTDARQYGFGSYQTDARGQIRFDYPPGQFRTLGFRLSAPGYRSSSEFQTNDNGLFSTEWVMRLARASAPAARVAGAPDGRAFSRTE